MKEHFWQGVSILSLTVGVLIGYGVAPKEPPDAVDLIAERDWCLKQNSFMDLTLDLYRERLEIQREVLKANGLVGG